MYQYLLVFLGVILVLGLRFYASYSKYQKARATYISPKILALDIIQEKNENIRFFVQTMSDGKELCTLIDKCIGEIKGECNDFVDNILINFRGEG